MAFELLPIPAPLDSTILVFGTSFVAYLAFKKYEPSKWLPLTLLVAVVPSLLATLLPRLPHLHLITSILSYYISYYSLILCYTAIYRLSPLHPLAEYPGPLRHKLSKLPSVWVIASGKQHLYYNELHNRYGDIVRVGPNELSVRTVDAIQPVLGSPGTIRGPFWDHRNQGAVSPLIATRNSAEHARRRKPWNRAFNSGALKNYEDSIFSSARDLMEALESRKSNVVDLSRWMSLFSIDFMGDMAFGRKYGLMREGEDKQGIQHLLEGGLELTSMLGQIPWVVPLVSWLPGPSRAALKMREFARLNVVGRVKAGSAKKDLFYHLTDEESVEAVKPSMPVVVSDGILALIAGSDTTATALSALWYYLLRNPGSYARLQREIDDAFPLGEEPVDLAKMTRMPFLIACINEALRLIPPVISGAQRSVLPDSGGISVGSEFIPGGTQVFVHTYSLHRDPRNFFPFPDSFWPDRWLSAEDRQYPAGTTTKDTVILNPAAFIPFSHGSTQCVGKNLALMELRVIACFILQKFDVKSANGFKLQTWEDSVEDYFTVKRGDLPVILTTRS